MPSAASGIVRPGRVPAGSTSARKNSRCALKGCAAPQAAAKMASIAAAPRPIRVYYISYEAYWEVVLNALLTKRSAVRACSTSQ
jgi:hypothetical protein